MSFWDEITNFMSGGQQKGAQELEEFLNKGMGEMKDYVGQGNAILDPYNKNGMAQYGTLQSAISRLMNPQQFNADMMKGYSMSPQAQHQMAVGNDAALNAAHASGMSGSTPLLANINENSQAISNRDQQQYLNNMMGMFNQGTGISQGLYNTGFGAASQQSQNLTSLAKAVADMYGQMGQARQQQDVAKTGGIANWLQGGVGALSKMMGGFL